MTEVAVSVDREHVVKLIKPSRPFSALVELVSNALDADSTSVNIVIEKSAIGGVQKVTVGDNGSGISFVRLQTLFGQLGGSWKNQGTKLTAEGRQLFGRSGQGRFRAYALGHMVIWTSVTDDPTGRVRLQITGSSATPEVFDVSDPADASEPTGCIVECIPGDGGLDSLQAEDVRERLANRYAEYLFKHRSVTINLDGTPIDIYADGAVDRREFFDLAVEGEDEEVKLEIVEWKRHAGRALVLFGEANPEVPLAEFPPGIHAPGFRFSAAITSKAFDAEDVTLADLGHERFKPILESARSKLRDYFAERQSKKTRELVEAWIENDVYPYPSEPADEIEEASRELFNIVAVTASAGIPDEVSTQRLSLRLLKEALETAPTNLRRVLTDVLELPEADVADLAEVLDQTSLTSIIATSRVVADRLTFLRSLQILLFDKDIKKSVLERSQLHRMLAAEPWVFGEQYTLGVDDKGLSEVLARHLRHLERDSLNLANIEVEGKKTAIVDLMLTKTVEDSEKQHHLVVELKRPDCTVGYEERKQIETYAMAVASDERFRDAAASWDFVLVANRLSGNIERITKQRNKPRGLIYDDEELDLRVWIRHWGGIIEDRRRSLHFAKNLLQIDPEREEALDALRKKYPEFVPEAVLDPGNDGADEQ